MSATASLARRDTPRPLQELRVKVFSGFSFATISLSAGIADLSPIAPSARIAHSRVLYTVERTSRPNRPSCSGTSSPFAYLTSVGTASFALSQPRESIAFSRSQRSRLDRSGSSAGIALSSPIWPSACTMRRRSRSSDGCAIFSSIAGTALLARIQARDVTACMRTFSSGSSMAFTSAVTTSGGRSPMRPSSTAASKRTAASADERRETCCKSVARSR